MKKNSDKSISSLLIDCQIVTSAKKISNYFNTFFTSVAVKTNKYIVKSKKKTLVLYLGHENSNTIFLSPTLPEDTEDLISSMKTDKASGTNSIPTKILKFKKEFSKPLSDLINLSFNKGILQNLLKIANVIPIHKKVTSLIEITKTYFSFI